MFLICIRSLLKCIKLMQNLGSCVFIEYLTWIIKETLTGFVLEFHLLVCIKFAAERLPTYSHRSHFFVTESRNAAFFIIRKFIAMFIKAHQCSSLKLVLKVHLLLSSYWNLDLPRNLTKYQITNKCTNCMSFILNHFFKTLFTAPTCFDSISLIIIREHI